MRIKNYWLFLVIVTAILLVSFPVFSQEKESPSKELDFTVGINAAYHRAAITLGDKKIPGSLDYSFLALQVDVDLNEYLTLGVLGGYNSNAFKDPVDFAQLPLPLRVDDQHFKSMMFGMRAKSDFLSWKDFSLAAQAELLFFKRFQKDIPFQPPVPSNSALAKNSFNQAAIELHFQYDGFTGFTLFAGPRLNLIHGNTSIQETVGIVTGAETLSYKQKRLLGVVCGIYYELGDHFDLNAAITLFSQTSISVSLFYIF